MVKLIVDIADIVVSDDPDAMLITYALGSCIAVVLYDPMLRVGGMIHYMLPLSSISQEKAAARPAMFADTGVPLLFHQMYSYGCRKENLVVKVVGGGQIGDDRAKFEIGKRNYTVLRRMLWKTNVLVQAEDVGGSRSRTVSLWVDSGICVVRSPGGEEMKL